MDSQVRFAEHHDRDGVLTLPKFRGQGWARATLQYALDFAWSRDCCKVMLLSGMQRPAAHRLYESLGFRGDIERGFVIEPAAPS